MDEVDLVDDVDTVGERKDSQEKRLFDKSRNSAGSRRMAGLRVTAFGEKQVGAALRADLEPFEVFAAFHHDGLLFVGLEHQVGAGAGDGHYSTP